MFELQIFNTVNSFIFCNLALTSYTDDDSLCHMPHFKTKASYYIDRVYNELTSISEDRVAFPSLSLISNADTKNNGAVPVSMAYFTRRATTELKLRMLRDPGSGLSGHVSKSTTTMLAEITNAGYGFCNTEAYYHFGLIALGKARDNGELNTLWKEHAAVPNSEEHCHVDFNGGASTQFTLEARFLFKTALINAPPASSDITKKILRCLALVSGPNEGQSEPGLMTASLIHMSIGGSSRNIVRSILDKGKARDAFQAFDDESLGHEARVKVIGQLLKDSANLIPGHWHISALAVCPSGEVLISSLQVSTANSTPETKISTACIFPGSAAHGGSSCHPSSASVKFGIHDHVLNPLDGIIERSQKQLHGINEDVQSEQYNEESSRRKWWKVIFYLLARMSIVDWCFFYIPNLTHF